jgi:hypothetical protein
VTKCACGKCCRRYRVGRVRRHDKALGSSHRHHSLDGLLLVLLGVDSRHGAPMVADGSTLLTMRARGCSPHGMMRAPSMLTRLRQGFGGRDSFRSAVGALWRTRLRLCFAGQGWCGCAVIATGKGTFWPARPGACLPWRSNPPPHSRRPGPTGTRGARRSVPESAPRRG